MSKVNQTNLPTRTNTAASDEDAVADGEPGDTVGLLTERLRAWKHMCGYLEGYIRAVSQEQKANAKDQEKVLKSISKPLREGHHFDQALGGIAGLFENMRANTSGIANMHLETSKNLDGTILPMLERLHAEIKNKTKEIEHGAGKGSKTVEKARNESQKYIELLGTHTAHFDSSGGKVSHHYDPYVLQRNIYHRLNKQLIEENNNRGDIITVQNNFQQFEAHMLSQVQAALNSYQQFMGSQADRQKAIYSDISGVANNITPDFEWNGFVKRNENLLVNPNAPPRSMANVSFPNQNHRATKALIEGSLERKSRALGALKGYSAGYYAVTPAGYLHQYKDNDDFRHEPSPDISLYLPDCTIGAVSDTKFTIKGKDASSKIGGSHEFQFKAHTPSDAKTWHDIISQKAAGTTSDLPTSPISGGGDSATASPISPTPTEKETAHAAGQQQPGKIDTANVGGEGTTSTPASAASRASPSYTTTSSPQQAGIVSGSTPKGHEDHYHGQPGEKELEGRTYSTR